MSRNAQTDIRAGYPTVIVLLTAGDAGNGVLPNANTGAHQYNANGNPYYRVRLNAHERAVGYLINPNNIPAATRSTENFGGSIPAVEKAVIGNVTTYYLNLPDGKMETFHSGGYASLNDVTNTNSYTPATLREVLRQIIARNNRSKPTVVINLPEYNLDFYESGYNDILPGEGIRPTQKHGDHPDHVATGKFVMAAVNENPSYSCLFKAVFMGYGISSLPDGMSAADKQIQTSAFYALNNVLISQGNWTYDYALQKEQLGSADGFHMSFFGKVLWRDNGGGSHTCTF
jgi:hypothetical protein